MQNSANRHRDENQNRGMSGGNDANRISQGYNDSERRASRAESSETGDDYSNTSTGSAYSASARKESELGQDYGFSADDNEASAEETDN